MDQNQTPSATTIDQNQTPSATTIDQNQTPSTATIDQTSTTTMNQNQTPSTAVSPMMIGLKPVAKHLVIRAITFIFLFVSLIVIVTDSFDTLDTNDFPITFKSTDIYAYRYMISADAIGMAYTLLLVWLTISQVKSGSPIDSGLSYFEFYGDKVILFLLATGAAAGLGLTVEYNRVVEIDLDQEQKIQNFLNMANASASLVLLGSVSSFISSVISSLNLPRKSS